jgi:hypothetical protein
MAQKQVYCGECESEFTVKHDLDSKKYKPAFCVFCGSDIIDNDEVDYRDLDSAEDE